MRFILIISLLISYVARSQIVADTTIAIEESGDTVKIITYKNASTTPFVTLVRLKDSIELVRSLIPDISGLATTSAMNTALGLKQNSLVSGNNIKTINGATVLGSGDLVVSGAASWGAITGTLSSQSDLQTALDAKLPKTTTSGVAASPTASGTQTITHNLGRTPTIIRIYGIGTFTSNAAATPTPFSMGVFTTSGNTCVYMRSTGTTTQVSQTSTTFSVFISTSSGNFVSGVIQNVGANSFDIVWTETGTAVAQNFLWEAQ